MRIPDFFIAGAPKCGTTALYSYLQTHPGIFLPGTESGLGPVSAKEPHYFCTDFPDYRRCRSVDDYLRLFTAARPDAVIGEGSVWYLYSEIAIPKIIEAKPRAKFIILLRNPVNMVQSLHNLLFHTLDEDIPDLGVAWDMQDRRAHGQSIPKHCRVPKHLLYQQVCSFHHQVDRLFAHVPREQCMIIISEELMAAPAETYRRVLQFLGVGADQRASFPIINASATSRSRLLTAVLRTLPKRAKPLYRTSKALANAVGLRPGAFLSRWNSKARPRTPLDPMLRQRLTEAFAPDIARLEQLLGRGLDLWRRAPDGDVAGPLNGTVSGTSVLTDRAARP